MKKLILFLSLLFLISSCTPDTTTLDEANERIQEQQQEIDNLRQQLNKEPTFEAPKSELIIDLTQWREDEIIQGLANINLKFSDATWFPYEYREDGVYYDIYGPLFPKDPFVNMAYSKKNRQLTINNLRLFNLDPGNNEVGDDVYDNYREDLDKELFLNRGITCTSHQECRGTAYITCTSGKNRLDSWFSYPYLFVTRDDGGETFEIFKEFYC